MMTLSKGNWNFVDAHVLELIGLVEAKVKGPDHGREYDVEVGTFLESALNLTFGDFLPARQQAAEPFQCKSAEDITHLAANRKEFEKRISRRRRVRTVKR